MQAGDQFVSENPAGGGGDFVVDCVVGGGGGVDEEEEIEFDVQTQRRLDEAVDKLLKGYDWTLAPLANKYGHTSLQKERGWDHRRTGSHVGLFSITAGGLYCG